MLYIQPTGLDSGFGVEHFYGQVAAALASERESRLLALDCSLLAFVRPEGIAALITVARYWQRVTGQPILLQNLPLSAHRYLERVDLFTQCAPWIVEERALPEEQRFNRATRSMTLLEVLPLAGEKERNSGDILIAHGRAAHILESWFDADEIATGRVLTMFSEIASNVVHSGDQGFAVMQRYRESGARRDGSRVVIAITDSGIGIEASLRNKPAERIDQPTVGLSQGSHYLLHALQLGVTGRGTVGGLGLSQVKGLVQQWDGLLEIRSQRSSIRLDIDGIQTKDDLSVMPGTQVTITVRGGRGGP